MLAIDCVWILLLGLYLEQVLPKKIGRRRHPCFMFTCEFWGCCQSKSSNARKSQKMSYDNKIKL